MESAENINVEENLTDLINPYLTEEDSSSDEQENVVENNNEEDEIKENPQKILQERAKVHKEYSKAQSKSVVEEAKKSVGTLKEQITYLTNKIEEIKKENNELKEEMEKAKSGFKRIDERTMAESFLKEMQELAQHEKYGKIFNKDEIQKELFDRSAKEGRYFTPEEMLKIQNFDKIYDELLDLKEKMNRRKQIFGFGSTNQTAEKPEESLADINGYKDPKFQEYVKKKLNNIFGE